MTDEVLKALGLRTPPFRPDRDAAGHELKPDLVARALDPRRDPRLVAYYHDVYDWQAATQFGGLSPGRGLVRLPGVAAGESGSVLILVSGSGQSGRTSIVNLIIHAIGVACGEPPLIVDVPFDSYNKAECVRIMASMFIDVLELEEPAIAVQPLRDAYAREEKNPGSAANSKYRQLFRALALRVRRTTRRPVVFVLRGSTEDFDLWTCAYHSASDLAHYVVVETSRTAQARTATQQIDDSRAVAHVNAQALNYDRARHYVLERLAAERTAAPPDAVDEVWPLTDAALHALFEPSDPQAGGEVVHPIGWLRLTLERAMDERIQALVQLTARHGRQALQKVAPANLCIDRQLMWNVRQQMNQGR